MPTAAAAGSGRLYTPRLLSLAAELATYPLSGPFDHQSEARSRTCGSSITLGVDLAEDGATIARIGMQVTACAIGQASAAIMAQSATGRSAGEVTAARGAIEAWLAGEGPLPDWPGFDALEPAHAHPGRHGALLLPWKALDAALSSPSQER